VKEYIKFHTPESSVNFKKRWSVILWNFLVNTLLLYIPLLTLTDGQKDRQRPNTLAACGLEELFSSCAVVSFFLFWREIGFGFTYLRTLLNKLFYELIFFLIIVEVLAIFLGGHFNLRKFLFGFFILQNQLDPYFLLLCISFLLCMDLHNLPVMIASQKYRELSLQVKISE
jgi:hypothetical protein